MIQLLAFLTGAATMAYELVWSRWVMLSWGAGCGSFAFILSAMVGGLALGSELGGRLCDRTPRPLRFFAVVELAIAAAAAATSLLLRWGSGAGLGGWLPRSAYFILAATAIAAAAAAMGMALPALAASCGRSRDASGAATGRMYSWNVAGATAGTLATGFFSIAHWGLWLSAAAAAALSAATAGLAWAGPEPQPGLVPVEKTEARDAARTAAGPALLAAGASGFAVMGFEVLDTRFLVNGFWATPHALAVILACFLAGLALGARLCAARLEKAKMSVGQLGLCLLLAGGVTLACAPCLASVSALMAYSRGKGFSWEMRLAYEALVAAACLLPATTAMGLVFPACLALHGAGRRCGASFGRISFVNSLAGIAGACVCAFILLPLLGLRGAVVATASFEALCGAWLLARDPSWPASKAPLGWLGFCAVLACGLIWARPARLGSAPGEGSLVPMHAVGRESEFRVLCYHEGPVATTSVLEHAPDRRRDLVVDGFVTAGDSPAAGYMSLMGRLPMSLHPDPRRALVICFGTGATAKALAEWPQARLTVVDIDRNVLACAPCFDSQGVLSRAEVHVEDGRRFLGRQGPRFDVITQEPMPPYFAGTAALYSLEYYRLARRRLSPDGIMVQWLPLHLVSPLDARQIVATALAVFPETWVALAAADGTGLVVSSGRPLDLSKVKRAEQSLGVRFVLDPEGARRYAAGAAAVTDDLPSLEYAGLDRVRQVYGGEQGLHQHNISELVSAGAAAAAR
jgi:spermidine synthase